MYCFPNLIITICILCVVFVFHFCIVYHPAVKTIQKRCIIEKIIFIADRPFIFILNLKINSTENPLFIGNFKSGSKSEHEAVDTQHDEF